MLARLGPVEALTLGQAVTVPIPGELFPLIADQWQAYDRIQKGRLPFPLIQVIGQFYDNGINDVVEEFAFAGLDLQSAERLFESAEQTDPRRPQTLDGPANILFVSGLDCRKTGPFVQTARLFLTNVSN